MNCKLVREKLTDTLAAGGLELSSELTAHVRSCSGCRSFYESEAKLLRSIDGNLNLMVNQEPPTSLVPGFHARLDQQSVTRRVWIPAWGLAAVAIVVSLALSLSYSRRGLDGHLILTTNSSVTSSNIGNPASPAQPPMRFRTERRTHPHNHTRPGVHASDAVEASPEVIVLAEEREAFIQFVAEIPENPDLAIALTRPALKTPDHPVEIALLQIESLEVRPLRFAPRE